MKPTSIITDLYPSELAALELVDCPKLLLSKVTIVQSYYCRKEKHQAIYS